MVRGGRSYVSSPPAFSNDSKRLLVCASNSVAVFSTATALQVASLEGHEGLVTSVIVVPATSKAVCFCWTASLDGTIRYWDFSAPELIRIVRINFPIHSMVIPSLLARPTEPNEKPSKVFAYISVEDTKDSGSQNKPLHGRIRKCNLTDSRLVGGLTLAETKQPESINVSPSGEFIAIQFKRKLCVWKVPLLDSERVVVKKITLHHTKTMTIVAFHPSQRIVAAGDVTGRILIWRQFGQDMFATTDGLEKRKPKHFVEDRPGVRGGDDADSCTTWHWHSAEVNLLSFSSDGAYLYSGGKEGVLVVWQMDTGKKKFLPRIGAPLLFLTYSSDPSLSSISCADNQIHLLKFPSLDILKSISGIKPPCRLPEVHGALSYGVSFDSNAGLAAMRTENYCIQLYSLLDDCEVLEVQVCERNHQPGDEVTVVVTLVVFSQDGSMMITAEERLPEEGLGGLVCLKFWASQPHTKDFSLSTVVYEPHRHASISAVAFHPTGRMAVSASYCGDFKVWACRTPSQKKDEAGSNFGWTCHAIGSYKKKPMTAAAFSPDGSVLAVAAESIITLWEPDQNILVAVIGDTLMPITTLGFVGCSGYLVSTSWGSKPQLSVWNMNKLSLSWSYMLHVEAVATAGDLSCFAVLAVFPESSQSILTTFKERDGVVLFFNVADPRPLATWLVKKARGGSLGFLSANQSSRDEATCDGKPPLRLAYINGDHEYILFDPHGSQANELGWIEQNGHVEPIEEGKFGYASLYGELPDFSLKRHQPSSVSLVPSDRPWESIFSGSSHNMPPLTKLCSAFLDSLLEKRTTKVE